MRRSNSSIGRWIPKVGLVILLVYVVAGCGSSSGTAASLLTTGPTAAPNAASIPAATEPPATTAAPASAAPTSAPAASAAPSAEPTTSAAPSAATSVPTLAPIPSFALPSFTSDKELEARLPGSFMGVALKKLSIKGDAATNPSSTNGRHLLAVLQALGKSPNDLSIALAEDPLGKLGVTFFAERIVGADAAVWAPQLYQVALQDAGATVTDVNLGGRDVKKVVEPKDNTVSYAWPSGDILFVVGTKPGTTASVGDAIAAIH